MNVPECMSITQIQQVTMQDEQLQLLRGYIFAGCPEIKDQVQQDIRINMPFRDDMAVIDRIIMKGRHIIIPESLKAQVLDQLHINHMKIEKQDSWHMNLFNGLT